MHELGVQAEIVSEKIEEKKDNENSNALMHVPEIIDIVEII